VAGRLAAIAEVEPIIVSSRTGEGLRQVRDAIDRLAAAAVPEARGRRGDVDAARPENSDEPAGEDSTGEVRAAG
jgi:class 3 adenylate cyclase